MKLVPLRRPGVAAALVVAALLAVPGPPERLEAHEIPADVLVRALVRPAGERLQVLVRVPLTSMRDVELPLRGPGYLDVDRARGLIADAARVWIAGYLELYEDGRPLAPPEVVAARLSLPSDPAFRSWTEARAHMDGPPLAETVELVPEQALLDVLLEAPIRSDRSRFSLVPAWSHLGLRTRTVLRHVSADGTERALQWSGDPGLVRLDPRWHHAALSFLRLGFLHILGGLDHLLFVLCLVIPLRRARALVPVVTAFTVAHSITLGAAALGLVPTGLWFPAAVETGIALSIVWMAFENIVGVGLRHRWRMAFAFGLVHGFGFSFFLRDSLQFAGSHLVASLLAFNVGVELGQVLVLAVAAPALALAFRRLPERAGVILLSALVAHTAWHWTTTRGAEVLRYRPSWPALDAALLAEAMRWGMLVLVAVGAAWILSGVFTAALTREEERAPRRASAPSSGGT